MTLEEALDIVQKALDQGRLSRVQELVFRRSWEKLSYLEIAKSSAYELGYIRDVGYKLWQLLSKAFGTKVTKTNFHEVLRQHYFAALQPTEQTYSVWTQELLQTQGKVPNLLNNNEESIYSQYRSQYTDWGDAIDVSVFSGRCVELATLNQWLMDQQCRLVVLLGMGGIGKTALAAKLAQQVQHKFRYLIWRSLRNAPPIKELLTELIVFLSHQQEVDFLENLDRQISRLMEYLRFSRCLLILDNAESILRGEELAGRYRSGYEGYGQLLRRVTDEQHQSCFVITSREKPIGLTAKEGKTSPVRLLQLSSLQQTEAQEILKAKGLIFAENEARGLLECYTGNPLVLKLTANTIQSLFDGNVSKFLEQGKVFFGDIWELLDQQFNRLSPVEKQVMYYLAYSLEPVSLPELLENVVPTVLRRELLGALESLQRRSLLYTHSTLFAQQPIIKKYITERLRSEVELNGKPPVVYLT